MILILMMTMMIIMMPLMYLKSFNSTKLKYVQPIITLMENNMDVLTWNRKTGEIVFSSTTHLR